MNTKASRGMTFTIRSAELRNRKVGVSAAIGIFAAGSLMAASPVNADQSRAGTVTVVARNLDNPRGLAFGPHGDLYIAEAGHGGDLCLGDGPEGPQCAGLSSGVSKLSHGRLTRIVDHLISVASTDGSAAEGLVAVSTQGNRLYGQVALSSAGIPPGASGSVIDAAKAQLGRTLAINGDGSWSALASTGDADYAWTDRHKYLQPDQFPDANPNGLATSGRTQYVADAGANLIAKVDNHGNVSTLAYLQVPDGSITDGVPTCIAKAPDGSLYVGELLGGDYAPGNARVWRIDDGKAKVKWTGFTGIQGCGFDDRGNFYATEFQANGMFGEDPSGAVIKVAPNGHRTTLGAGSLSFPSGFAYHHGAVYVSNWSVMPADNGVGPTGQVVKISVD
jgi:sugar lactone lactonase YvrE